MSFLDQEAQDNPFSSKQNSSSIFQTETVMAKIGKFIDSRQISISQFWQSDRNCASATDIVSFCRNCSLYLPQYDVINLKSQIFANKETISVDQFSLHVPYWQNHQKESVSEFLKKRSDLLLQKMQSKERIRPKTGMPSGKNIQSQSAEHFRSLTRHSSANRFKRESQSRPMLIKNNSKDYLRKYKEKELNRQKQLHDSIEKNKVDQQYNMLLKMSQLNTINKERQNKTTYRAYKSAEGIIKVRVFNFNKFEKEISLNQFDTIYKNFKKSTKQNKEWTVTGPTHTQKCTDQLQKLKNRNTLKSQRQQQLKNLLVGTVNLTNLLKEQIKIFREKGILPNEHQ